MIRPRNGWDELRRHASWAARDGYEQADEMEAQGFAEFAAECRAQADEAARLASDYRGRAHAEEWQCKHEGRS